MTPSVDIITREFLKQYITESTLIKRRRTALNSDSNNQRRIVEKTRPPEYNSNRSWDLKPAIYRFAFNEGVNRHTGDVEKTT